MTGCKILFQRIVRGGQRVTCWLHKLLVVHSCIVKGQSVYFYFFIMMQTPSISTYFVHKIFHICMILNFIVQKIMFYVGILLQLLAVSTDGLQLRRELRGLSLCIYLDTRRKLSSWSALRPFLCWIETPVPTEQDNMSLGKPTDRLCTLEKQLLHICRRGI